MNTHPPLWAEALLRLFLGPGVFANISGDLLEQYRDSIHPARGAARADAWYVAQVLRFVARKTLPWAALFAAAEAARAALDLLRPTTDFYLRSEVSTALAAGILLLAGFWTAWRSGSFSAGAAAGLATTAIAAALGIARATVFLAIWHDAGTLHALRASGGLEEFFLLPAFLVIPGMAIGGVGGLLGAAARRLLRPA